MSNWTHSICAGCWEKKNPEREAVRTPVRAMEKCCFCGMLHASGIYVREDPKSLYHCSHTDDENTL